LSAIAHDLDVDVYRGSEDDVLRRFAEAAREFRAETIVRVCADSPLVAPEFIDAAIDCYEVERPDLAYNLGPRYGCEFPFGMGCEVFGKEILNNMDAKVTEPQHREHVTAYLHNHRDEYRISIVPYRPYWVRCNTNIHLTVDLPEDLDYIRRLASCMQFDTPVNAIVERIRTIK
jgi:spore coat polysaccharide biosynthesis protein SpsF